MFLLVSCSLVVAFQCVSCFVQGQRTKEIENKNITRKLAGFITSVALSTVV